ncbi:YbbR-like protein [bacterium BMS3Abin05]|nr:YbbR-like protein [bacterium BMS3Abin05]GBE26872.1 YbbR-like protein [bacterium BMS3Bbin03]
MNIFRKIFFDYKIKLFIVAIAVLLWLYVSIEDTYEYNFPVRIVPVNVRSNYLIVNNYPREALVKFRGKGKNLFALKSSDKQIRFDLAHYRRKAIYRLRPEMVEVPSDLSVQVLQIVNPDTVVFVLERKSERELPIIPNISMVLEPGYIVVGEIKITPPKVRVSGPKSVVDTLKILHTRKLFFEHVKSDLNGKVRLVFQENHHLTVTPKWVRYSINVQQLGEKTVKDIPVKLLNAPVKGNFRVIPSTISVTIEGGVDLLDKITAKDIYVYIDYKQRKIDHDEYKAIIELPPETRFSNAFPHTFKVVTD